eukprot:scaffold339_cov402-Prasinococcus_capsulatus_cf.AAC.10
MGVAGAHAGSMACCALRFSGVPAGCVQPSRGAGVRRAPLAGRPGWGARERAYSGRVHSPQRSWTTGRRLPAMVPASGGSGFASIEDLECAEDAMNFGLELFEKRQIGDALEVFGMLEQPFTESCNC